MRFINYDAAQVEKDLFTDVRHSLEAQGAEDFTINPGDERYMFLKVMAYHNTVLLGRINDAFLNTFVATARAEYLDNIGGLYNCTRKSPGASTTLLQFSIAKSVLYSTVIPQGTTVTADKKIFFKTVTTATIPAGGISVQVKAVSTIGGVATQKYTIGSITTIVDTCGASGVTNLTIPEGADDGEPYPYDPDTHKDGDDGTGDNAFRKRIQLALAAYSTCGAQNAYIYWAKSVNATISDVKVVSDVPNVIELVVVCEGEIPAASLQNGKYTAGILPSSEILESVVAMCNGEYRRSLGDTVSAQAPELVPYDIELKYYTMSQDYADCSATIENANGAIQKFIEWQDSEIGKHINPTKLEALCVHPNWADGLKGAVRVEVVKPEHADIGNKQLARFSGNLTVTHELVTDY